MGRLREGWSEIRAFEATLGRPRTPAESILEYLDLRRAFSWQLRETAELFQSEHEKVLAALQERLRTAGRSSESTDG